MLTARSNRRWRRASRSASIERDLGDAVGQQHLTLAYQPICNVAPLQVRGFEVLLRWNHPNYGWLMPTHSVPLAEANEFILPLGQWALEATCAQAVHWDPVVCLSVNFSSLHFRLPDLAQRVAADLWRTRLPGERLDLEVTEGLLLGGTAMVLRTTRALKEQDVRITLDDFGTAYASLSTLRRFPFDRIKIDKPFIKGMCDDISSSAIVEAILLLGTRLTLSGAAEEVETEQQLDILQRMGCILVQGFLTARPIRTTRRALTTHYVYSELTVL